VRALSGRAGAGERRRAVEASVSTLNTPEGFLQVYYSGPSSGFNPPMVQITWQIGNAIGQAYISVEQAEWLGNDITAIVKEVREKFPGMK
jgi:hypothetical protein